MARIRSVHPGLSTDEAFMAMTPYAMAAWPILWTECDDHGVFEWKPLVLKARILPATQIDFTSLLDEWLQLECVISFEINGKKYGVVKNFCRYQRPKKPAYRFPLPDQFHNFVGLKPSITEPVPNQFPTGGEIPPQREDVGGNMEDGGCIPPTPQLPGKVKNKNWDEKQNGSTAEQIEQSAKANGRRFFVIRDSEPWMAWKDYRERVLGIKSTPATTGFVNGKAKIGWYFQSLYPPETARNLP